MKRVLAAVVVAGSLAVAPALAQVELDRVLVRIGSSIITRSDVRQARMLRLVPENDTDDSTRLALENRVLILNEVNHGAPLDPVTDGELSARRREWEGGLGAGAKLSETMVQAGMSEAALQSWLRDDCRIRAYLARQFGPLPETERARATSEWLQRLRTRAGLK